MGEETTTRPKPMVEVGGKPILWHIMKQYSHFGYNNFHIALGYKADEIKRFFMDCLHLTCDVTVKLADGTVDLHAPPAEDWVINLIDTGLHTNTGGRLKRLEPHLKGQTFLATYGDGVSDVNLADLLNFHYSHGRIATLTAVRPPARFGCLLLDGDCVVEFQEKPETEDNWINGGYFVFEPELFDYIEGDESSLEYDVLHRLAAAGEVAAFRHDKFWQCMDTVREKRLLESLWEQPRAPWKVWD